MRTLTVLSLRFILLACLLFASTFSIADDSPASQAATTSEQAGDSTDENPNPKGIYKKVDKDGKVTFSSSENSTAEKIEVKNPNSINIPITPYVPVPQKPREFSYESLIITAPKNEETITGVPTPVTVTVSVTAKPALNIGLGHQFKLYSNGAPVGEPGTEPSFTLTDLYRGTYTLRATIVDNKGKEIFSSDTIEFYIHQHMIPPAKPKSKK